VLEPLFGAAAASRLAARARHDLADRLAGVLERDAARFRAALDEAVDAPALSSRIRSAAEAVARSAGEVLDG
jgi:hypothetical protein